MYARGAGNIGPVAHGDVARQHGVVGQDHLVAEPAVVGDEGVGHQQAMVADGRLVIGLQRPMHGDVLANGVAGADDDGAGMLGHVDVLRQAAQHVPSETRQFSPKRGAALNRHVAFQDTPAADPHPRFNHAKRTDLDPVAQGGFRADQGQGVDRRGRLDEKAVKRRGFGADQGQRVN